MKLWPFRKRNDKGNPGGQDRVIVPFPDDIDELPMLKYHGLRALCGMFMDRHSTCQSPHPFCGNIGNLPGAGTIQLIAHVIPQANESDGALFPTIYFTRAESKQSFDDHEAIPPFEYVASLDYYEKTPSRKLVVSLVSDGTYIAQYGSIANPVEGDYSTGSLDWDNSRTLYCNPEPSHTRWEYWQSELTAEQLVVPEYRCLMLRNEWWIVDADRGRGFTQQVAALTVADDPNHNFGIHSQQNSVYYVSGDDGSELSKVLKENLPRTFL